MNPDNADTTSAPDDVKPESEDQGSQGSEDVKAPFAPHEDDDSALGDSDQHSTA